MKIVFLSLFLVLASVSPGVSEEVDTNEEVVYAIQQKVFHTYHELGLNLGYIANDDFFNSFPVGISYTYSFNEHFSWEVGRYQSAINQDKDLKEDLEKDFGVTVSELIEPKYFLHSNLIFRPLYGKSAFLNRQVINRETYFLIGAGIANYQKKFRSGLVSTENAPSIAFGVGTKYFINDYFALDFEVRDLVNLRSDKTENSIYLGVGLKYRFNLSPRKAKYDPTVEKLQRYLNED